MFLLQFFTYSRETPTVEQVRHPPDETVHDSFDRCDMLEEDSENDRCSLGDSIDNPLGISLDASFSGDALCVSLENCQQSTDDEIMWPDEDTYDFPLFEPEDAPVPLCTSTPMKRRPATASSASGTPDLKSLSPDTSLLSSVSSSNIEEDELTYFVGRPNTKKRKSSEGKLFRSIYGT